MKPYAKIVLQRSPFGNRHFYFSVRARNGKIIAQSETYRRKENALKGIRALVSAAVWIDKKAEHLFEDRT